ncbi:MAG: MerR family transcriptional regulator, partial [Proteobacteria bacterium]
MRIGELAKQTGINSKRIRHYESIGLLGRAKRTQSGYRDYTPNDLRVLRFIVQARKLGFSIADIKQLINLWKNKSRSSRDVKILANAHLNRLRQKIAELEEMSVAIQHLVKNCHGDQRP